MTTWNWLRHWLYVLLLDRGSEVDHARQNSPVVVGVGSADWTTPEDTLDHGNTGRVLAAGSSCARVDARVTLKVEVE